MPAWRHCQVQSPTSSVHVCIAVIHRFSRNTFARNVVVFVLRMGDSSVLIAKGADDAGFGMHASACFHHGSESR